MVSVPHVAEIRLHFGGIGPAGEGMGVRKPVGISKVKSLEASVAGRQHPVCRDFQVGIAACLVAGKDRSVRARDVYLVGVVEHVALIRVFSSEMNRYIR